MSRAQRIAFVCPRFSEQGTIGGAETLLKALAECAANDGREVDFLTTCATDHFTWKNVVAPGTQTSGKLRVTFFPVNEDRNVSKFLEVQQSIGRRQPLSRADEEAWITNSVNSRALIEHLEKNRGHYDRIIAGPYLFGTTYFASLVAPEKFFLVPCLHDEPFAYLSIMRDMFHRAGGFLFNTMPERELARKIYGTGENGAVVGLGLDDFAVDPSAFARKHGIAQPYVIYSGRRESLKGTPLLTDYMNVFRERTGRDVRLVFTGSGPIDAPATMRDAMLDVGFVGEQEKHEAMAGAVCFIHPSVNESLGIVLLESWLARTPAIVHAKSVVLRDQCQRSGGGLWFRYYPEFEECLLRLLDDQALRASLAGSGRRYVLDHYSWAAVSARLFKTLDAGVQA
jgi:glycosyltransferase involved in cell wall biosynthesis